MKIFNLIFCFLFIISAGLQYNDPDPYIWIPIYLAGAILCWMGYKGKFYPKALLTSVIIYLIYAVYLFFAEDGVADWLENHNAENIAQSMKATKPWIEATREFFGLCILMFALLVNYFYLKRKSVLRMKNRP